MNVCVYPCIQYMCAFLEVKVHTHANINICAFSTGGVCAHVHLDACFMYMCFRVCMQMSVRIPPNEIPQVWKHLRSFRRLLGSHRIEI